MWDEVYRALADPQRRAILKFLRQRPRPAGDVALALELGASTLSHHLKLLREADLVRCEKRGTQRIYSLNTSVLEDLATDLLDQRIKGKT
jgi:DNA-binding transcriptional ArsR family regulator